MKHLSPENPLDRADQLQRPAFDPKLRTTVKPLIITGTLVSRVDDTPWSQRPHDKGSSVDTSGTEVEHPEQHQDRIAIEADPNLAFERWDEYWRKVHGPKFAYAEPGSTSQLVMRYDQLHRLPSGPSSEFRPPYRAMVDASGTLVSDPAARVPPYKRPRWDGLAYIAYNSDADITRTLEDQDQYSKRILADEQVAFRVVTREVCHEHILIAAREHRTAFSLVKIHIRQPQWDREQFRKQMLHSFGREVLAAPATHSFVTRYAQLHNVRMSQPDPEGSRIDSLSIFGFRSLNDVEDFLISADVSRLDLMERELCSPESEFWTAANYSIINRLSPEFPTEE